MTVCFSGEKHHERCNYKLIIKKLQQEARGHPSEIFQIFNSPGVGFGFSTFSDANLLGNCYNLRIY